MRSESFRLHRMLAAALILLAVGAQAGCVVIPTSSSGTFEEQKVITDALVGSSVEHIRAQLGEPDHAFEAPGAAYLVYRRDAEEKWLSLAHPIAIMWFQLPVQWGSARLIQCLLIESRDDEIVRADIKSIGHKLESALPGMPQSFHPGNVSLAVLGTARAQADRDHGKEL